MSLIEIPDPPGYRVVAYRPPKKGEWFVNVVGCITCADYDFSEYSFPILQPLEVWRDATIDDLKRAPLRARMRARNSSQWTELMLVGAKWSTIASAIFWLSDGEIWYSQCQVLESPHS
jgi:hypothetical protein